MGTRASIVCALALGTWLAASAASAATLGFSCITNGNAGDCAIGAAQLSVEVTDAGGGQVLFSFHNSGPAASSIADVYFDDGALLTIAEIINSTGVLFTQYATPGDLPGGNGATPPFNVTAGFSADSSSPVQPNGVNPGEVLGIRFDLASGLGFQDVLDDLADGSLRIGLHVQGYASGGSESFVNAPEPAALALVSLAGLAFLGLRRRDA